MHVEPGYKLVEQIPRQRVLDPKSEKALPFECQQAKPDVLAIEQGPPKHPHIVVATVALVLRFAPGAQTHRNLCLQIWGMGGDDVSLAETAFPQHRGVHIHRASVKPLQVEIQTVQTQSHTTHMCLQPRQ